MHSDTRIRPVTYGLAFYFLLGALDAVSIPYIGSFLKIAAFLPVGLLLLSLKELRIRIHRLLIFLLCFWILALSSLFYSVSVDRTLSADQGLTLNLMLVLMLGVLVPYNRREVTMLYKAMILGCWLQIVLTLVFADVSAAGRLTLRFGESTQDHNNNNTFFLLAFSHHCDQLLRGRKRMHSLLLLLILGMVLLSGSRGALLAYALTFFFHICVYFKNSRNAARSILIALLVMIAVGIAFDMILTYMPERVSMRFSWEYLEEKGTVGRTRTWGYLWKLFADSDILRMLLGHGYGTTAFLNQLNHRVAHNLYLDNLMTLGIFGMLLQIASQATVVWVFFKRKQYVLLGAYLGMIGMCMSLSLTACKPLWNMMIIALAMDCNDAEPLPAAGKEA